VDREGTTRRSRALCLFAALAAAAAIAGCGGDDGDSSSSSPSGASQPAADLVAQADAICTDADKERPKSPQIEVNASASTLRSTADYFETDLAITQDTLDQLSELDPPEGLEDQWETVLDGFRAVTDNYPALIDAAKAGDYKAFMAVVKKIQRDTEGLAPAAAEVGLQVCATSGG
jgi:hypothetical protein